MTINLDTITRFSDPELETLTEVVGRLPLKIRPAFTVATATIPRGLPPTEFRRAAVRLAKSVVEQWQFRRD
jgi:hypothetical protein